VDEPRVRYATTTDGVSIAYTTLGDGPPIVAIMPFPWTNLEAAWQLPEIRDWQRRLGRGRRLVAYDSRGLGLSERACGALSLDALVRDLEAVVDHAQLARFALMTAPTTGPIAITYAARHAERVSHLLLAFSFARGAEGLPPQFETLLDLADRDWDMYTETVAHAIIGWSEGEYAHRFARFLRQCATPAMNRAFIEVLRACDVTALLPRLTMPTLVLHRRELQSPSIDVARGLAARIPDARLVILEGASPAPFIGDMEAVGRATDEFLDGADDVAVATPHSAGAAPLAILVTDVVGSTALTERLGDAAAREALRAHEQIVRAALRAHGGAEVKTMGDGFIASFPSVTRALECAIAVQRALADAGSALRVRIGLNAGEPIAEEGDLYGTAVIMASRLAGLAAGGEILVADVVRQLAAGKGFRFVERGEMTIRGFAAPAQVYEVVWGSGA
jgi:class 3 adenylate cyclase